MGIADRIISRLEAVRMDPPVCRYCEVGVDYYGEVCYECHLTKEEWDEIRADRKRDESMMEGGDEGEW